MSPNAEQPLAPTVETTPQTCTHHWVIETPKGPVSRGVCKRCGEARLFKNYLDNSPYWEDESLLERVSSGARFHSRSSGAETADAVEE